MRTTNPRTVESHDLAVLHELARALAGAIRAVESTEKLVESDPDESLRRALPALGAGLECLKIYNRKQERKEADA